MPQSNNPSRSSSTAGRAMTPTQSLTKLVCKNCSSGFLLQRRNRRGRMPAFCSMVCRRRWHADRRAFQKHSCAHCGGQFESKTPRACCSPRCAFDLRGKRSGVTRRRRADFRKRRTCEQCGIRFRPKHHRSGAAIRGESAEGRFCGRKCQHGWLRARARAIRAIGDLFGAQQR
jgi:hypothetical protein